MNTVTEIEAELAKLVAAMTEKGIVTPEAQLQIKDVGRFVVSASCDHRMRPFNYENHFSIVGDTAAEAIEKAREFIAKVGVKECMSYVEQAIETGHFYGIADEYLAPLHSVKKAMTDNLLTHSKEDVA